ncbi:MAG: dihydropteroate synthase [Gammaproteobacteria bacterium]|jgi:dihydropteroate synthase
MKKINQRPQIMGILNITPDSFSDGGNYLDVKVAIDKGLRMVEEGANIIDIGGESTRPGAKRMPASVQMERVLPVIEGLKQNLPADIIISIDTTLAEVAEAAIKAGASMINDISAGQDDAQMFMLAASKKLPLVLMHMQGTPEDMQTNPSYSNVIDEMLTFLSERIIQAKAMGVEDNNIILDPGIGFGKSFEHNLEILRQLDKLVEVGYRVLLGASRKRFLHTLCNNKDFSELCGATCAITALGINAGVSIFRVHDVRENRQTADITFALGHSSIVTTTEKD